MFEDKEDEKLPIIIRPECHFLEFPFFALSRKGLKDKKEIVFRYEETRKDERGIFEWRVLPSAKYGCPSPFDRRVMRAVDAVVYERIKENGYPVENPVKFSIYHLAKIMKISSSGEIYKKTKDSLRRVVATTVESRGSFWLKDKKRWIEDMFHVYDRVKFTGEKTEDGETVDTNCLWLGDFILRNINSQHVRPLNYIYLADLKSDIAARLYEVLSGKFYSLIRKGGKCFNINYLTLCQLLPITPQKYISKMKEKLKPAHDELKKTQLLEKVDFRRGKNGFVVVYYPGKRAAELTQPALMSDVDDNQMLLPCVKEDGESVQLSDLEQELRSRGLSRPVSVIFCRKYPNDYLCEKIEMFDFLRSTSNDPISKNPSGWLRKAIEEDWQPTEEQQKTRATQAQKFEERERQARWIEHQEGLIEQELNKWDDTTPKEKIKGRLDAWKFVNHDATQEMIEKKRQEYVDSLPQTNEEKREYLSLNYPDYPSEDFE